MIVINSQERQLKTMTDIIFLFITFPLNLTSVRWSIKFDSEYRCEINIRNQEIKMRFQRITIQITTNSASLNRKGILDTEFDIHLIAVLKSHLL